MKKVGKVLSSKWVIIWIIAAVVCLYGGIALARYNNEHNVVKRVIANDSGSETMFSSNYLQISSTASQIRTVPTSYTDPVVYPITIMNYSSKNPTQWYQTDLDFTLTPVVTTLDGATILTAAQFEEIAGDDSIIIRSGGSPLVSINKTNFDSVNNVAINQTITRSSTIGTVNNYELVLPNSVVGEDIAVRLIAIPAAKHRDLSGTQLTCRFGASHQTIILTQGWAGSFSDNTSITPGVYEGFNYSITGSGESTGTITWRYDLLEPNINEMLELFEVDITDPDNYYQNDSAHTRTIVVPLSSADNAGRYDFQLYIVDQDAETSIESMSWSDFENACVFIETQN